MDRDTAADEIAASDGVGNMFFHNKVSLVICSRWMICAKAHSFRDTRFVFPEARCGSEGKFSTSTNAIWTLLWFPLLRSATLTLVLPVGGRFYCRKRENRFFLATRQRKRALTIRRARYGGDQASACLFFRCPITVVLPVVLCPMTTSISASRGR